MGGWLPCVDSGASSCDQQLCTYSAVGRITFVCAVFRDVVPACIINMDTAVCFVQHRRSCVELSVFSTPTCTTLAPFAWLLRQQHGSCGHSGMQGNLARLACSCGGRWMQGNLARVACSCGCRWMQGNLAKRVRTPSAVTGSGATAVWAGHSLT